MRVALVIERVEDWRGGAERSTLEFAERLAARGVEVDVVTSSGTANRPGVSTVRIPVKTWGGARRLRAFVAQAAEFVRREPYDVVHALAPLPTADVYQPRGGLVRETLDRNIALRRGAPARWLKRAAIALSPKQRTLLALERAIVAPGGPLIAALSQYVARQCRDHYGLAEPRVRIVFNGVAVTPADAVERQADRLAVRARHGIPAESLLLLCVAHNFRLKGVGPLIEALARGPVGVATPRLVIVGRDQTQPFQRLARRLGVSDRVTFAGAVDRSGPYFHAADVCVHPTYYDPCSRVVLEAVARGVPVITTAFNGAADVLTDGLDGYVLSSPDAIGEMTDRIDRLRDATVRARMAEAAAQLAPRVTMDRHVEQMRELYDELRRSVRPPTP